MTRLVLLGAAVALTSQLLFAQQPGTYWLYRSSSATPDARIHVATFDAAEGEQYNAQNCQTAARLFGDQPGVIVRYWCEARPPTDGVNRE